MAQVKESTKLDGQVRNRLFEVRSQLRRVSFFREAIRFAVAGCFALVVVGTLDYFMPLSWFLRVGLCALIAIAGLVVLIRWLKFQDRYDEMYAAEEIENANPELGQRLRTSHQFETTLHGAPEVAPQLTSALIDETNQLARRPDLASPISWRSVAKWSAAMVAMAMIVFATMVGEPESRTTFARMFMLPIHYSNLAVTEMEPVVAGNDATFSAVVTGRPLEKVELWVRQADQTAEWTKVPMLPAGVAAKDAPAHVKGELTAKIEGCEQDLIYKVVASPLPTAGGSLKVLQPLEQTAFQATIDPPTYTAMEKTTVSDMEFSVVEGSLVGLELQLTRQPATAQLVSTDSLGRPIDLKIDGPTLSCDLAQLEESKSYEIQAAAADGMKFNSDRIRIRVKKDKGPAVAFQKPKEELSVLATTEVSMNLRATDDFGLGKVGIEYQINGGERQTLWEQDLGGNEKQLATIPVLYLEEHQLTHEDAITYYAFAEDNRPDPKRTRSKLQFIDIQPFKQEFQVVDSNCQGSCNCLTLEELIKRQRHNLSRTFANLDRQPVQDALSKRLAQSQREIQAATEEFAAGWELQFGPMPMLHTATKSMDRAADALDNKALDPAMELEESALANLIQAKQNARKFLKNCKSSGQFSQCKKFDTSMAQKIRKPESKKEQEQQQSVAKAREEIREMAEKQKRFSEDIAASSGGAKLDKKQQSQSQPSQSQSKSQGSSSSQSMAQSQQSAAQKAKQMQQQMQGNSAASQLAQQRMDQASEKIQQSAEEMEKGNAQAAADNAKQAADLLEQLDEHLKGLSGEDLTQRMAIAEQIATRLSNAENQVAQSLSQSNSSGQGNSGSQTGNQSAGTPSAQSASSQSPGGSPQNAQELADTQQRLASGAETLADLIRHLEADALGTDSDLRQGLDALQEDNEPEEIANQMQQVSQQIANGDQRASRGASSAAGQLRQVASALGTLRRGAMQPKLDELLAAEAAAAELIEDIKAQKQQASLAQSYEQLQKQLADLNVAATQNSSNQGSNQAGRGQGNHFAESEGASPTEPEFSYAGRVRNGEIHAILNVLQTQIQDAILLTARMDADQPVPAKYRDLVDEYYQKLSDDLR